jgi:predicted nucleotidyltransferase
MISQPLQWNFFGKGGIFLKTVGIICEYNPFHLGHKKQFDRIRSAFGQDAVIVCLMSGNFVQRGISAIFDKSLRAQAAIDCGADLVLELPVTYALSSAEGFAAGGVKILSPFCDYLCFGCENGNADALMQTAAALLSAEFSIALRQELESGCSFPVARQRALEQLGVNSSLLQNPNDILAVEYCKAILAQNSSMQPFPIRREGSYHDTVADTENPSATAVRELIVQSKEWDSYLPAPAATVFCDAPVHTMAAGERAMLGRLRTMTDADFEALPYGSEGLWRKLMHSCREHATLEEILTATKSKRYTRTRLDRMVMCAYLGITQDILNAPVPYVRVLGLRNSGIPALKTARKTGLFPHIGEKTGLHYEKLEQRWDDLYGLFRQNAPSASGQTGNRRIYLYKE